MKDILSVFAVCSVLTALVIPSAAADGISDMRGMSTPSTTTDTYGVPGRAGLVTRAVTITALDTMHFEPAQISVRAGQTVRFVVRNDGKVAHEFVIGDRAGQHEHEAEMRANPKMKMDRDPNGVTVEPGGTQTLIWHFPARPATLEYACHEPGHFAAGMVGYIHVVRRTVG